MAILVKFQELNMSFVKFSQLRPRYLFLVIMIIIVIQTSCTLAGRGENIELDIYVFNVGRDILSGIELSVGTFSNEQVQLNPGNGLSYRVSVFSNDRVQISYLDSLNVRLKERFYLPSDEGPLVIILEDNKQPVALKEGMRTVPLEPWNGRLPFGSKFSDDLIHGLIDASDVSMITIYCWETDKQPPVFQTDLQRAKFIIERDSMKISSLLTELAEAQMQEPITDFNSLKIAGFAFFDTKDGRKGYFQFEFNNGYTYLRPPSYPIEFGSHEIRIKTALPNLFTLTQQACK